MFHNKLLFVTQTNSQVPAIKGKILFYQPLGLDHPGQLISIVTTGHGMRLGHLQSGPTQNCPPTLHTQPATHTYTVAWKIGFIKHLMISYKAHIHNPQMTHSLVFSLLCPPLDGTGAWAGVAYHWNPSSVGHTSCVPRILSYTNAPNRFNIQRLGCMIKVKHIITIIFLLLLRF